MPDLIYNVKFEIDQASAQKVGSIVDSSNSQDIKILQQEVERLNQILKENSVENGKVKKSIKEKILAYKEEVSNLKLLETKINKSIQVYGKFSNETKSLALDLQRQAHAVDTNGQELLELANASDRTTGEIIALTNAVSTGNRAMVAGAKRAREMARAQKLMGGQLGATNKTFAAGNQAVFSFSDLIQDSTQFMIGGQFNFASGMRAIGNNIGFTAELLAVMSAQAKAAGQSLKGSLLQSLKGVNGVVLGINVAVTAFTMVSQALTKQSKELNDELEKQKELLEEVSDSFSDAFGINSIKLLERVGDIIEGYGGLYEEQAELQKDIAFLTSSTSDGLSRGVQLVSDENELLNTKRNRLSDIEGFIASIESRNTVIASLSEKEKNDVLEIVKARREELELRRNMRLLFLSALTEEEVAQQIVDAKNQVFTDMEKKYKDVRNKILEDPISSDLLQLDEPLFPDDEIPVGSIASLQQVLKELTAQYETETDKSERAILDSRIQGIQTRIDYLKNGLAGVLSLQDLGVGDFEPSSLLPDESIIGDDFLKRLFGFDIPELEILGEGEVLKSQVKELQDSLTQITEDGAEKRARAFIKESENFKIAQEQKVQALEIAKQATMAVSGILQGFFGESKALAIAETTISTYFAAQKAYESQFLPVPTPDSPLRGKGAAALAIAQGLARVAAIKSTNLGGGGAAGVTNQSSSAGFGAGSSMTQVTQPTQNISFRPSNESDMFDLKIKNEVVVTPKGLALITRAGEREIANSQKSVR